jgi:DNA-directed RNA polymerase specialized sigma subunit
MNEYIKNKDYCTVMAQCISDMPKAAPRTSDMIGNLVARYDNELNEYVEEINSLLDKKKLIEKMLSKLDRVEYDVIINRYINNPTFHVSDILEWVGYQVNYSRAHVSRIHNRAIEKMEKWLKT